MSKLIQFRVPVPVAELGTACTVAAGTIPEEPGFVFVEKPVAKSSTSVATGGTTCRSCGCRKGPGTKAREGMLMSRLRDPFRIGPARDLPRN